jgi:hypothetical protein
MKKIMALILVIILLMDLNSCHSYNYISNIKDYETNQDKEHVYALDLITSRDSTVYFSSRFPGKLSNNEVKGPRHVLLQRFEPDSMHINEKGKIIYIIRDSIRYNVINQHDTILVCILSDTTCISFSEIKQMHIKKIDKANTALAILGIAGVAVGIIIGVLAYIASNMDVY